MAKAGFVDFFALIIGGFLMIAALCGSAGLAFIAIRWCIQLLQGGF
jgi:hypothetical protein